MTFALDLGVEVKLYRCEVRGREFEDLRPARAKLWVYDRVGEVRQRQPTTPSAPVGLG